MAKLSTNDHLQHVLDKLRELKQVSKKDERLIEGIEDYLRSYATTTKAMLSGFEKIEKTIVKTTLNIKDSSSSSKKSMNELIKALPAVENVAYQITDMNNSISKIVKKFEKIDKSGLSNVAKNLQSVNNEMMPSKLEPMLLFVSNIAKTFKSKNIKQLTDSFSNGVDPVQINSKFSSKSLNGMVGFINKINRAFTTKAMVNLYTTPTTIDIKDLNAKFKSMSFGSMTGFLTKIMKFYNSKTMSNFLNGASQSGDMNSKMKSLMMGLKNSPFAMFQKTLVRILKFNGVFDKIQKSFAENGLDLEKSNKELKDFSKNVGGLFSYLSKSLNVYTRLYKKFNKFNEKANIVLGQTGVAAKNGNPNKLNQEASSGHHKNNKMDSFLKTMQSGRTLAIISIFNPFIRFALEAKVVIMMLFNSVSKIFVGVHTMFKSVNKLEKMSDRFKQSAKNMAKGWLSVFSGLGIALAMGIGTVLASIKFLLDGASKYQKNILNAGDNNGLNPLLFSQANQGSLGRIGLNKRFAGADEKGILDFKAAYLSQRGGMPNMAGISNNTSGNMSALSQIFGISTAEMATLYDVMQNVMKLNAPQHFTNMINKMGHVANKVIKDISSNLNEFVLYGQSSFERLSNLTNRLGLSTKNAIGYIQKFSTVSGSIETSYNMSLLTGKFQNPLSNFMQYAYGDPTKLFEQALGSVGDINKNRIYASKLAETLNMSVDQLIMAKQRMDTIKRIGESNYQKQYKTLDEIVNSMGFQRLLGDISGILDYIYSEVFNGVFKGFLDWIKTNAESIPGFIDNMVNGIKNMLPIVIDAVVMFSKSLLWMANYLPVIVRTVAGAMLGQAIGGIWGPAGSAIGALVGGGLGYLIPATSNSFMSDESYSKIMGGMNDIGNTLGKYSINDGYVSGGKVVKTDPNDIGVFGKNGAGLLNSVLKVAKSDGSITPTNSGSGDIKIIKVSSNVNLDGQKVGEGLTEIAFSYV